MTEPITQVQDLVRERYVLADRAVQIADALSGFKPWRLEAEVATQLTAALRRASQDKHLAVRHYPGGVPARQDESEQAAFWSNTARRTAGGMADVRRVPGVNAAVLAIGPSLCRYDDTVSFVSAAFALAAGAELVVLDVRDCMGGTPDTIAYLISHLVPGLVHLQDVVDRTGKGRTYSTTPGLLAIGPEVPVRVLTSARTFSGGEELAYDLQVLGRAEVFGEITSGAAHLREVFDLTDSLQLSLPVSRSVNAVTGTNWEGVGVQPDVVCPAEEALECALGR